ncbi:uncharacterized protein TNCV_235191 [Trichonephila clavipes]|uniref:Polyprotein n=1 Tax=Trichonephila clavipes TaxID=2585209 RepID=A0A8X6SJN0_TRICX|nr:uncharacterized protein TNCV_235191 [Trichonephila clavipes]
MPPCRWCQIEASVIRCAKILVVRCLKLILVFKVRLRGVTTVAPNVGLDRDLNPGLLAGRALDWFVVLGYRDVEDKATDYAHLKQALSEQFPAVRNRPKLETRFYSLSQKHNQNPSDFVYELLKTHKILKLEMTKEKLTKHIISRSDGVKSCVLYHEVDTGDKGPVVSRPYRYDRDKQGIIDYHIEKMLQDGAIRPIQSQYASPVVLTRKNNGFPPDSPEVYRFAIDYRKLF